MGKGSKNFLGKEKDEENKVKHRITLHHSDFLDNSQAV